MIPTVIVFGREEPQQRRDALAVLRVVEVVAPAVEVAVLVRVVAGEGVDVPLAGLEGDRGDDPGHVDVGQAVGEVVDVDVDPVAGHLALDPRVVRPGRGKIGPKNRARVRFRGLAEQRNWQIFELIF